MANGCRVYRTTNLALPQGIQTVVSFDAERWDDGGYHDSLVNPSRITIPVAGRYWVFAALGFNCPSYAFAQAFFRVNGSLPIGMDKREIDPGNSVMTPIVPWEFAQGDYIEVVVWNNKTGTTLFTAPSYTADFGVERIP